MSRTLSQLRFHVFFCDDAGDFCGCEANGSHEVVSKFRKTIAIKRLAPFVKTTLFTCNQPGAHGPVAVVYPEGVWYDNVTLDDVEELIERQIVQGEPLERLVLKDPVIGPSPYAFREYVDPEAGREGPDLVCPECHVTVEAPWHCNQAMVPGEHDGKPALLCWMGAECGVEAWPEHHGVRMTYRPLEAAV